MTWCCLVETYLRLLMSPQNASLSYSAIMYWALAKYTLFFTVVLYIFLIC